MILFFTVINDIRESKNLSLATGLSYQLIYVYKKKSESKHKIFKENVVIVGIKMDSEMIENTEIQNIPSTQENGGGKSQIRYAWGIFFEVDVNVSQPFLMLKLRDFLNCDFPWRSIWDVMTQKSRCVVHEFPSLFEGKKFHIFAKVQYGMLRNQKIIAYSFSAT